MSNMKKKPVCVLDCRGGGMNPDGARARDTMNHYVPNLSQNCDSTTVLELELLNSSCSPTSDFPQQVPSPRETTEWNLCSPTMFSAPTNDKNLWFNWLEQTTPTSLNEQISSIDFSTARRIQRLSSIDSGNLSDSLMEQGELQSHFEEDASVIRTIQMPFGNSKTPPTYNQSHQSSNDAFDPKVENNFENPLELDEDSLSEVEMNPVVTMAMDQVKKDIESSSQQLGISSNPADWTRQNVITWMNWTMAQYNLDPIMPLEDWVGDGPTMSQLNEAYFKGKIPNGGDVVHAMLDVWKQNAKCNQIFDEPRVISTNEVSLGTSIATVNHGSPNQLIRNPSDILTSSPVSGESQVTCYSLQAVSTSTSVVDALNRDDKGNVSEVPSTISTFQKASKMHPPAPRTSSSIHLWQFIRELLNDPHLYSGWIHWVDRDKGIFKIVDSVRVAQQWGKRKNRPLMNYDKLSRSLRQYYKKGIMKKTEHSQRLVYQFCPPYHL